MASDIYCTRREGGKRFNWKNSFKVALNQLSSDHVSNIPEESRKHDIFRWIEKNHDIEDIEYSSKRISFQLIAEE